MGSLSSRIALLALSLIGCQQVLGLDSAGTPTGDGGATDTASDSSSTDGMDSPCQTDTDTLMIEGLEVCQYVRRMAQALPAGISTTSTTDCSVVGAQPAPGAPLDACYIGGRTLTVEDSTTVLVNGTNVLYLIADDIVIAGTLKVLAGATGSGGTGPSGTVCGGGGGAGGSMGGSGGRGGTAVSDIQNPGGSAGITFIPTGTTPTIVGGRKGQDGAQAATSALGGGGGPGGGGVWLVATRSIRVLANGRITASGLAGLGGATTVTTLSTCVDTQSTGGTGGGGGGSGGYIRLSVDASGLIEIAGRVTANGGSGGEGGSPAANGGNGADGSTERYGAIGGGMPGTSPGGNGGTGSAIVDALDGGHGAKAAGGGGGGGRGLIIAKGTTPVIIPGAIVSPDLTP